MSFYHYQFLYLLVIVPLYWIFETTMDKRKQKHLNLILNEDLLKNFKVKNSQSIFKKIIRTVMLSSLIISLARPQWGKNEHTVVQNGVPIAIIIDISNSMYATDIKPSRIENLHINVNYFIDQLQGNPVGVVGFANSAFIASPLTTDYISLKEYIQSLTPIVIRNQGTDIGNAIKTASKLFKNNEGDDKVMILITDGEDHGGQALKEAELAQKKGISIYTLGIGSPEGDKVGVYNKSGELIDYLKDKSGKIVISKTNFDMLKKIAEMTGGQYVFSNTGNLHLDSIYDNIKKKYSSTAFNETKVFLKEDRYYIFLSIAFFAFLLEFFPNIFQRKEV